MVKKTTAGFEGLRGRVSGTLTLPGDAGYDDARQLWNAMIDRHPAALLRVESSDDIAAGLLFAQEQNLPIAVRGGGHGVAGNGSVDGGLVIDLGNLNEVLVDARACTVRIAGGAKLGDVDRATEPYRLVVPLGVVSGTGVAGLTLGGGVGWLTRAYGLSVDNLASAEVVTAAGEIVVASETENSELFWGLRGGGGNFGVVSSFTFRAHPLPEAVYSGTLVYEQKHWALALRAFEEWARDVPDALTTIITFLTPPAWLSLGDQPLMLLGFAWANQDFDHAARVVEALRQAAPPDAEAVDPAPWTTWQSALDEVFPKGVRAYWKNTSFDRLDDDVIDTIVQRASEQTWQGTGFDIHHMGGAYGRVSEETTAFPSRSARFWLNIYGFWGDGADDVARMAYVRGFASDMAPFSSGGQYINFMGFEEAENRRTTATEVWGAARLERLVSLKRKYDPSNLFRLNHNIMP
jgi:FAD/FMN-containing dehydrogenase